MTSNDAEKTLRSLLEARWSCRAYLPDPVPREDIETILDIARRTPSWCNTQPWHVHVLSGAGTERFRDALSTSAADYSEQPDLPFPFAYEGVYLDRRRESGWQLYDAVGIAKGDRAASAAQAKRNFELFGAPHAAVVTTDAKLGVYGAIDCGLFVETFLLAAHALGIAAIPQAAIASQAPAVREFLGLPPDRLVLCGISFGYADTSAPENQYRTSRQTTDEVATWVTE